LNDKREAIREDENKINFISSRIVLSIVLMI